MRKPPDIQIDDESDPSSIDTSNLTYLGLWGGAAALALLMVAAATMSETGQRRLATLFGGAGVTRQAAAMEADPEASGDAGISSRRLAEQLRNLAEDRDRLLVRMTALERNYEDATGSVARLAASPKASRAAVAAPDSIESLLAKTEIGIDLGGAPNVAALRTAWERIRRSHAVQFEGLRPVIGIREGQSGQVELRLVVGPVTNADVAAKLCATLANVGVSCQPTNFDGQKLALR